MGKVIIRFWESYQDGHVSFKHISLQTSQNYFSFLPSLKEEKEISFEVDKHSGKYSIVALLSIKQLLF